MRFESIVTAEKLATDFVARVEELRRTGAMAARQGKGGPYYVISGQPKETGALRRASMELTRALAQMRRYD